MCGPYIQEQLCEGLSTGFLPDELPVYPILNGTLLNPVPLNYFNKFPHHIATGFAFLSEPANCSTELAPSKQLHDAVTNAYSDTQSSTQRFYNRNGCSSSQQIPKIEAAMSNTSYPPLVLPLLRLEPFCFLFMLGPCIILSCIRRPFKSYVNVMSFFLFYSLNHSQGMNHLGSLRMMRGGNMDHTLSWSFIPGIITDI